MANGPDKTIRNIIAAVITASILGSGGALMSHSITLAVHTSQLETIIKKLDAMADQKTKGGKNGTGNH